MDRRQRKTRDAIFHAFTRLLSEKDYDRITVSEIIDRADIGRTTFYSHFETKDSLLQSLCEELFCHIFDAAGSQPSAHKHIFDCDAPDSVILHLLRHLQKNDNNILDLLAGRNNTLFLQYFKSGLQKLIVCQHLLFESRKSERLPDDFWSNHIAATFVETVRWWVDHGMAESPETIAEYFCLSV